MVTTESLATIIAGLFAFIVYLWHRRDEKRNAAIILLAEIRFAENAINQIRTTSTISDLVSVMDGGHWKEYQHLFATSLDRDDIELINNFYATCNAIEERIKFLRGCLTQSMTEKIRLTQEKILDLADKAIDANSFTSEQKRVFDLFWTDRNWFEPSAPKNTVLDLVRQVQPITTTTTGRKLKRIAVHSFFKS